MDVKSLI